MKLSMSRVFFVILLVLAFATACQANQIQTASLPVGRAYAEGVEIYFIHTEASDAEIASTLTSMMDSPVLHVPSLAEVSDSSLGNVYVFANGITGQGPLGFQPDVFDNPPGSSGYSPLRRLNVVTWNNPASARELMSAVDVMSAEKNGEISISTPGVVINMPFVVWDGGKR